MSSSTRRRPASKQPVTGDASGDVSPPVADVAGDELKPSVASAAVPASLVKWGSFDWLLLAGFFLLAVVTRFWRIDDPKSIIFDEVRGVLAAVIGGGVQRQLLGAASFPRGSIAQRARTFFVHTLILLRCLPTRPPAPHTPGAL